MNGGNEVTPQTAYRTAGTAYQAQAVETAGPAQLVLMLYDGAVTAIARATQAMADGGPQSVELVNRELTRAQEIITELQLSLDHEQGGTIAASLNALYGFYLDRLARANIEKQPEPLRSVTEGLTQLREAWTSAAERAFRHD